jgi:hypothetical protein
MRQCDQRLLLAQVLDILERDGLSFSSLLGKLIKGRDILLFGMCEADYEEEVCVQVAVVKGADCVAGVCILTEQNNVGCTRLDE